MIFFHQMLKLAGHKDGQDDGQDGLFVFHHGDGDAQEGQGLAVGGISRQVRVQQRRTDHRCGVGVHVEDLAGAETENDGHEVHQGIRHCVQNHIGAVGGGQDSHRGQDGQNTLDDAGAGHGANAGQDAAGNGFEEAIVPAVLADHPHAIRFGLACIHGIIHPGSRAAPQQFFHFGAKIANIGADGNLILSAAVNNPHDPLDLFDLIVLGNALIFQDKAQPCHTIGHTDDVFFAAHSLYQFLSKLWIIFSCHRDPPSFFPHVLVFCVVRVFTKPALLC